MAQGPRDRQQLVHGLAPPAPAGEREEAGRFDAGAAGQCERGGNHGEAARLPGDGVHALPIDGMASLRRVADDHGEVGDPGQPDEAVMRLAGVGRQHDQFVCQR